MSYRGYFAVIFWKTDLWRFQKFARLQYFTRTLQVDWGKVKEKKLKIKPIYWIKCHFIWEYALFKHIWGFIDCKKYCSHSHTHTLTHRLCGKVSNEFILIVSECLIQGNLYTIHFNMCAWCLCVCGWESKFSVNYNSIIAVFEKSLQNGISPEEKAGIFIWNELFYDGDKPVSTFATTHQPINPPTHKHTYI